MDTGILNRLSNTTAHLQKQISEIQQYLQMQQSNKEQPVNQNKNPVFEKGFLSLDNSAFHGDNTFFDRLFIGEYMPNTNYKCHISGDVFIKGNLVVDSVVDKIHTKDDEITLNDSYKMIVSQNAFHFTNNAKLCHINSLSLHSKYVETDTIYSKTDYLEIDSNISINKTISFKNPIQSITIENASVNDLVIKNKLSTQNLDSNEATINDLSSNNINCKTIDCENIIFKNNIPDLNATYLNHLPAPKSDIVGIDDHQTLTNKSFGSDINMNGNKILNIREPYNDDDIVTKKYVDDIISVLSNIITKNIVYTHPVKAIITTDLPKHNYYNMENDTYQLISMDDEPLTINNTKLLEDDLIIINNKSKFTGYYRVVKNTGPWVLEEMTEYINVDERVHACSYVESDNIIVRQEIKDGGMSFHLFCKC